jgi:hypothetical protein
MRELAFILCLVACGGPKKPAPAPSNQAAGSGAGGGSGSAMDPSCPEHLDCMPPLADEPCPPDGFEDRCPRTDITY